MPSSPRPEPQPPAGDRVIAFVGSAGSIEALRTVLSTLEGRLQVPMIVLVHQSPDRPDGALTEALGRPSGLVVREAEDGSSLERGHALVVPAGRHMLVHPGGRVQLITVGDFPPYRPSADLLLASMATALGPAAVAVVLSGGGSDGATGATAIHHNGGTVITTDRETSLSFAMPRATIERDSIGPVVVAVEDLATVLITLAQPVTAR